MTHFPASAISPAAEQYLLRLVLGACAIGCLAAIAALLARGSSAALRHRIWSLGAAATLALPLLLAFLPQIPVGLAAWFATPAPAPTFAVADTIAPITPKQPSPTVHSPLPTPHTITMTETTKPRIDRPGTLLIVCSLGSLWLILRLIFSLAAARSLARRAVPIDEPAITAMRIELSRRMRLARTPRFLQSHELQTPVCLGLRKPAILLPSHWRDWPVDRLRAVLIHELAHIARRDLFWQTVARLSCALYWFLPFTWLTAWRMRVERELACDDYVLAAVRRPTHYAQWLIDFASAMTASPPATALAIAARGGWERRIRALLDPKRRRNPLSATTMCLSTAGALLITLSATILNPLQSSRAAAQLRPTISTPAAAAEAPIASSAEERLERLERRTIEMLKEVRAIRNELRSAAQQ